jgi:triosephosphate isomerase
MSKRDIIIAGNWKMNKFTADVKAFADGLDKDAAKADWCQVVIAAPYVLLPEAVKLLAPLGIGVAAQNINEHDSGAYTGDISPAQLTDIGVKIAVIGHSERRQYNNETDESVNAKTLAALNSGIYPIVCVGESEAQRELGITNDLLAIQVKTALRGVPADKLASVVIAYEPIWAIGTGKTATSADAEDTCRAIREVIAGLYGGDKAETVSILYGGSMNEKNAKELLAQPNIDGGLIGGASLDPAKFSSIIKDAK